MVNQVGKDRGSIPLNGSLQAVDDFRQRAGLQPQQTLTIPPLPQKTVTPEERAGRIDGSLGVTPHENLPIPLGLVLRRHPQH